MPHLTRRSLLATTAFTPLFADSPIDDALRSGIARRNLPAAVAMFASPNKTLYAGAFGTRDSSGAPLRIDGIFQIASMTKAITSVAALQFVEQKKIDLDEPVARVLPRLKDLDVLDGFDPSGKPQLRPAKTPITLRHLLTHTSGLCYDIWDGQMFKYTSANPPAAGAKPGPLMFEPGTRWQYGQGVDWAGRLVEALSGISLEDYFQQHIFRPLGMSDTSYILPPAKFDRLVSRYHLDPAGKLVQDERRQPAPPTAFNGGGGLFSTAADYVKFMQMILNGGAGPNRARILQPKSVESMMVNHIGAATAGKMKSYRPTASADVDIQPGQTEKWGLGFLINTTAYPGGRSAGSLAWAGLYNTFYWIDPKRRRCGVILMQFSPFVDEAAIGLLSDFETAAYRLT
jgi:CubicO group peptidase (beta-lactamase class C family)